MEKEWSYTWTNFINPELELYPIQFANCERLRANKAVYIFDEVGSGKTISSGLMAADYLYNKFYNPICCRNKKQDESGNDKEILIVSINALVQAMQNQKYGQFLNDWNQKISFFKDDIIDRYVKIVNNHFMNIPSGKKYGLVIVDEAHLFLNTETERYKALSKIKADKVIFLTATPIKNEKDDLKIYLDLAKKMTGDPNLEDSWKDAICTDEEVNAADTSLICSKFDEKYPVTRYFKDTINCINQEGRYENHNPVRMNPKIWNYAEKSLKNEVLLEKIKEVHENEPNSKFLIFTRYVDRETNAIAGFFGKNGFVKMGEQDSEEEQNGKYTYDVITGKNSYKLPEYTGEKNLPTVLILTYQIAEQGVNFPGFNYVINYNIPRFPSSLEQRFGRVDRINSKFKEINICFLIAKNNYYDDRDTLNFYVAINKYLRDLISCIPARNAILSENIISDYGNNQEAIEKSNEQIKSLIEDEIWLKALIRSWLESNGNPELKDDEIEEDDKTEEIVKLIQENGIEIKDDTTVEELKQRICKSLPKVGQIKKYGIAESELYDIIKKNHEKGKKNQDEIFYLKNGTIKSVTSEECAKSIINDENFKEYNRKFNENIKVPSILKGYYREINDYFEERFIENDFEKIFPDNGYKDILKEILIPRIEKEELRVKIEECDGDVFNQFVQRLPFFRMCGLYEGALILSAHMEDGKKIKEQFEFPISYEAFKWLKLIDWNEREKDFLYNDESGLGKKFIKEYFTEEYRDEKIKELFQEDDEKSSVEVENWYKLEYYYTKKIKLICENGKMRLFKRDKDKKETCFLFEYCLKNLNVRERERILLKLSSFSNRKAKDSWTKKIIDDLNKFL